MKLLFTKIETRQGKMKKKLSCLEFMPGANSHFLIVFVVFYKYVKLSFFSIVQLLD